MNKRNDWLINFWLKLIPKANSIGKDEISIIVTFEDVKLLITTKSHKIGLQLGNKVILSTELIGFKTQPWIFYSIARSYEKNFASLFINSEQVLEVKNGTYKIFKSFIDVTFIDSNSKIIKKNLSQWIDKRASLFKLKRTTSDDYYLIEQEEQEEKLIERINALEDLIKNYKNGKTHFFDDIVANIRSLIFYKRDGKSKNYDPLLLRIASFKKQILKVFIMPNIEELVDKNLIPYPLSAFYAAPCPYLNPKLPNIKEADFQEYLELNSILYNNKKICALDIIESLSTTQSTAHFDQRLPKIIGDLKFTPKILGYDMIESFILDLASIIVKIGNKYFTDRK